VMSAGGVKRLLVTCEEREPLVRAGKPGLLSDH
jgi:hypothetical protein